MKESKSKSESEPRYTELETPQGVIRVREAEHRFKTDGGEVMILPSCAFTFQGETYMYYGVDEDGKPVLFKEQKNSETPDTPENNLVGPNGETLFTKFSYTYDDKDGRKIERVVDLEKVCRYWRTFYKKHDINWVSIPEKIGITAEQIEIARTIAGAYGFDTLMIIPKNIVSIPPRMYPLLHQNLTKGYNVTQADSELFADMNDKRWGLRLIMTHGTTEISEDPITRATIGTSPQDAARRFFSEYVRGMQMSEYLVFQRDQVDLGRVHPDELFWNVLADTEKTVSGSVDPVPVAYQVGWNSESNRLFVDEAMEDEPLVQGGCRLALTVPLAEGKEKKQENKDRLEVDPQGRWWKVGGKWMINMSLAPQDPPGNELSPISSYRGYVIQWDKQIIIGTNVLVPEESLREALESVDYASDSANAILLEFLDAHPEEIPKSWDNLTVFFPGTKYKDNRGNTCVRAIAPRRLRTRGSSWVYRNIDEPAKPDDRFAILRQ